MKKLNLLLVLALFISSYSLTAQVAINTDGTSADGSAMLEVKSTDKGFLPPRMTETQRDAISSPVAGLLIFQTDGTQGYYYYTGTDWIGLVGTGPGSISTTSSILIDADGNTYPTITIGNQEWMAENLKVTHFRNGDAIPIELNKCFICWFDNDQTSNEKFGSLYNWNTVNDSRGLCPTGWHVPTQAEWTSLATYLGGFGIAGGKMKATSDLWNSPNTGATNSSSFSGLAGGLFLGDDRIYNGLGDYGLWWSSTMSTESSEHAYSYWLPSDNDDLIEDVDYIGDGYSVRCVRD